MKISGAMYRHENLDTPEEFPQVSWGSFSPMRGYSNHVATALFMDHSVKSSNDIQSQNYEHLWGKTSLNSLLCNPC
jgi:hypothetical protein